MGWLTRKVFEWTKRIFNPIWTTNWTINLSDRVFVNGKEITDPAKKKKIYDAVNPAVNDAMEAAGHAMDAAGKAMDAAGRALDEACR